MILRVDRSGTRVDLIDPEQLRELKVVAPAGQTAAATASTFGDGARLEDDSHIWIPAETILALAGGRPAEWEERFRETLRAVEPAGWYDGRADAVRVHIETTP
ncbi:MAG TPA: hypothetical protein VGN06_13045 [Gaiellaceae bacterium]|jgi:hypothetical protein